MRENVYKNHPILFKFTSYVLGARSNVQIFNLIANRVKFDEYLK